MNIKSNLIHVRDSLLRVLASESQREIVHQVETEEHRRKRVTEMARALATVNRLIESS